ncbi:unnamed protein product [Owenia fusiformis]|uniref:Uncharacterized protein n=1 Tax=Owenia fusiformis TaxID=6347 RepID=A0A8J1TMI7_OWEFU|nr:unnamed protein product [Owenia fusiformis]
MKTFDGILDEIGGMGRYQILAIFLLALLEIPGAFHNINYVYIGAKQDHFCAPSPELSALNLTKDELRNYTIPYEVKDGTREYMKCGQFRRNYSSIGRNDVQLWLDEYIKENYTQPDDLPIGECSGWLYDTSIYQTTIISEVSIPCT